MRKREIMANKNQYANWYQTVIVAGKNLGSTDCEGSYLVDCEDLTDSRYCFQVTSGKNNLLVGVVANQNLEYSYDNALSGNEANHVYGCHGVSPGFHLYCTMNSGGTTSNLYYSSFMIDCSFCFGCHALKNKSYCIFNKQYEKDERYEKVNELLRMLEEQGLLGEFFPGWMNPFYFNDTVASLVEPTFTKEEVESNGYLWRDEVVKVDIPEGVEVVKWDELDEYEGWNSDVANDHSSTGSEGQWTINPSILKKVIEDEEGNYYRIIPMEYKFLKKYGLPLPRKHWLARLKEHFVVDDKAIL